MRVDLSTLLHQCDNWIRLRLNGDATVYFLTYDFNKISDDGNLAEKIMKSIIRHHYRILLSYINRLMKPSNSPLFIAFPDREKRWLSKFPVERWEWSGPNEGFHFHAFLIVPRKLRKPESLRDNIQDLSKLSLEEKRMVRGIQASLLTENVRSSSCLCEVSEELWHDDDILLRPKDTRFSFEK